MVSGDEIRHGLGGALALARLDPSGLERFDVSVDGFWKSFVAPLIAIPAHILLIAEQHAARGGVPSVGALVPIEVLSFVMTVTAFPVVAIFLTRLLGLGHRYVPLIVAGNWSVLPQLGLILLALVLANLVPEARGMLLGVATIAALVYGWFVIRTALATTGLIAFGLLLVDVLISLSIDAATDRLVPAAAAPPAL